MTFDETIAALEAELAANPDAGYAATRRFHAGERVTAAALDTRERDLDAPYPPSFRDAILAHGLFSLGKPGTSEQLVYRCWPLAQHRSALAEYADQLDCDPTAAEVASQIGLEEDVVAPLAEIILVGLEGHEDYIGFDLRTRNPKTRECRFGLVLFADTEIEALANEESEPCEGRGFDVWLARHIARRA
jgi:hypothetical protein